MFLWSLWPGWISKSSIEKVDKVIFLMERNCSYKMLFRTYHFLGELYGHKVNKLELTIWHQQAATRSCFYAGFAAQRNFAEVHVVSSRLSWFRTLRNYYCKFNLSLCSHSGLHSVISEVIIKYRWLQRVKLKEWLASQ